MIFVQLPPTSHAVWLPGWLLRRPGLLDELRTGGQHQRDQSPLRTRFMGSAAIAGRAHARRLRRPIRLVGVDGADSDRCTAAASASVSVSYFGRIAGAPSRLRLDALHHEPGEIAYGAQIVGVVGISSMPQRPSIRSC